MTVSTIASSFHIFENENAYIQMVCKSFVVNVWHMAATGDDTYAICRQSCSLFCCRVVCMVGMGLLQKR